MEAPDYERNDTNTDSLNNFWISVVIDHPLFISRFIGNSLWLIALVYYIYISFLGYSGELNLFSASKIKISIPHAVQHIAN